MGRSVDTAQSKGLGHGSVPWGGFYIGRMRMTSGSIPIEDPGSTPGGSNLGMVDQRSLAFLVFNGVGSSASLRLAVAANSVRRFACYR